MPSWIVPSDSHSVGDTGHTTDHNHMADDLTLVNNVLPVVSGGLTGAVQAVRLVGATTSGAPVSGTFAVGDFLVDQTGKIWICTAAGSPGTWANAGSSSGVSTFNGRSGAVTPGNGDYLAVASGGLTGATAATRYVGGTTSGAPASGTFAKGDFVVDQTGVMWVCTTAGSPGTWTSVSGGGGSGSVTSVSVVSANGFAGTVATPTTTPAVTLKTTVNGIQKGNSATGVVSAAVAGTDYLTPTGDGSQLTGLSPTNIARVFCAGHSFTSGFLNTEGGERWATRLAAVLGAEEVTYAQTSAMLAQDDGGGHPGGYASVLNGIIPRSQSTGSYTARSAQPYLALSPVSVFNYGYNDLAYLNATVATAVAWFKMALRACVCLARSGGYFPDTHSSVAYSSGWTANTGQGQFGSPTNHSRTSTGGTVTITTPADFPGGEVDLLTQAKSGGTKWSVTVDGGSAQVLDGTGSAFGSSSGRANLVVQRLTGLSAGAHTIVMTVSTLDSGASAVFDSWLIAAPQLPQVYLVNQAAVPGLPITVSGALHSPVTSSDVSALNTAIAALPAEFTDGNVILADVATAFANANANVASTVAGSGYVSDGLHPNSYGHALIAATVLAAIRSAPAPSGRTAPAGRVLRQVQPNGSAAAWPNGGEPAFKANWFIGGSPPTATFSKGPGNVAEVVLDIVRSSAPSFGEVIFSLPPGYAPSDEKFLTGLSFNASFTVGTVGVCSVRANGDVVWYAGDPTTLLQVSGAYVADGPGA